MIRLEIQKCCCVRLPLAQLLGMRAIAGLVIVHKFMARATDAADLILIQHCVQRAAAAGLHMQLLQRLLHLLHLLHLIQLQRVTASRWMRACVYI